MPKRIEAAFTWYNGGVYFFKQSKYWLFVPGQNSVNETYSNSLKEWWWAADEQKYRDYNVFRFINKNIQ